MDILQTESQILQRNKVRNILIRYCDSNKVRRNVLSYKNYQHPENTFLVKYFPKYYKNLALVMKPKPSLLFKIKKIKKLKRFSSSFHSWIPRMGWFKILANNRKEIEEFPKTNFRQIPNFLYARATLHIVKFFFQITKLQLPVYKPCAFSPDNFLSIWKVFAKYLRNMRNLKILKFDVRPFEFDEGDLILRKLNGMTRLLGKLEVLSYPLRFDNSQEILFQNKNIFSHLTHLNFPSVSSITSPISQAIPQFCKNLKAFSLKFSTSFREVLYEDPLESSKLLRLMAPIQELPKLQNISIDWSALYSSEFWSYFTPPASLRNLELKFNAIDIMKVIFNASYTYEAGHNSLKSIIKYEGFFDHWKEINELDTIDFQIHCGTGKEMLFTKNFITAILKKISKLISFKCNINLKSHGIFRYEPFKIEAVSHLYEHLKRFQVLLSFDKEPGRVSFDFGFLKPFRNLKEIDFEGYPCSLVNIGEAIRLLEGNWNNEEFLTLRLAGATISYQVELKNLLKEIFKAKKFDSNLKIELGLNFVVEIGDDDDELKYLDQFCEVIESRNIKGLEISLDIHNEKSLDFHANEVKRVLDKYPGLRNFVLKIHYEEDILEYIKRDGEKEQLL